MKFDKDETFEDLPAMPQEISPITYQYYKGLKHRRIILNDQIDNGIVESLIIPLIDMDNDGTGEPIEIMMCSPGGSVFDSLILCDIIDNLKTPTTIRIFGYAFSMGSLLLMAGFNNPNVKRVCYPFSVALIHAGSKYLEGSANQVKDTFKFQERIEDKIKDYVLSHSRISKEEYDAAERYERYLTSEDMLRLGLVDEIL